MLIKSNLLRVGWWPAFCFIFTLIFTSVGRETPSSIVLAKYATVILAVVGWFFVRFAQGSLLESFKSLSSEARGPLKWPLILLLGFGVWSVLAGILSEDPAQSLTGAVLGYADSALMTLVLSVLAVAVCFETRQQPQLPLNMAKALSIAGGILALLAILEVVSGRTFFYPGVASDVPVVSYPQRGHLAGMLIVLFASSLCVIPTAQRYKYVFITSSLLLALALGFTLNRIAIAAVLASVLLLVFFNRSRGYYALAGLSMMMLAIGWAAFPLFNQSGLAQSRLSNLDSGKTRGYIWKSSILGVVQKPLTGWGGGNYTRHWADVLSFDEVKKMMKLEYGQTLIKRVGEVFFIEDSSGKKSLITFGAWKAHNQFIEVALLYGLPGLLLYLVIMLRLLKLRTLFHPAILPVLAYHVFLMLWFSIPETEGVMWALIGSGLAVTATPRAPFEVQTEPIETPSS